MAIRAISATELGYLRRDNQWSALYLHVDAPATVYTARLNGAPASTNKVVEIIYDGGSGTLADVLAGMTLAVGTSAGACDKGLCRIRTAPDATKFYIGETSEIDWADNDYLTVLDEFGLWPRHMYKSGPTDWADYNLTYSNQHTVLAPVVVGGPDPIIWLDGATVDVAFDVSESWVLGGGTITYAWSAPASSGSSGATSATPTLTYNAAGRYRVSCTATANGKTTTRYWHVQVYDTAHPPLTQFVPGQIASGDDGYSFTVTLYAEAGLATIRDRARVALFAKDHYGDTEISLGQVAGRENIVAWGWIAGETIEWSAELSTVTFDVRPPGYWLQQITGFPAGFENTAGTANAWTNFHDLTVDKGLWSLLYFRSTAPLCLDFSLTGDTKLAPELPSPGSIALWEQIFTLAYQAIMARPRVDRMGRLWVQVDAQYLPPADRAGLATVMTLTMADWRDKITLMRNPTNRCSLVDLSGGVYDGATWTALFALASGDVYLRHGQPTRMDRLVLSSQAQANELAGLVMGQANNLYSSIPVQLAANNRMLDVAPNQFVSLTVAAGDTPRGVAFTLNLLPRRITYQWEAQSGCLWPSVEFEGETFAALAVTGQGPAEYPDPPISDPPVIVSPGDDLTPADLVYVLLGAGLYRSVDFSQAAPSWSPVGLELAGSQWEFILDPYFPKNTVFVSGDSGVWSTANLDSYANFANVHTAAGFAAATGETLDAVQDIRATIAEQNRLYCIAIGHTGAVSSAYVGVSTDGGATWAWTLLGTTTNATDLHGLACSQHNALVVLASAGAGKLYKSTDGAATFSLAYTVSGANKPIANIELPYQGNGSDLTVIIGGDGGADPTAPNITSITPHFFSYSGSVDAAAAGTLGHIHWTPAYETYASLPNNIGDAYFAYVADAVITSVTLSLAPWSQGYPSNWHQVCSNNYPPNLYLHGNTNFEIGYGGTDSARASPTVCSNHFNVGADWVITALNGKSVAAAPYIMTSPDGGTTFTDITPVAGGAIGWRGLHSDVLDSDHLTALVGTDPASLDLVVSPDGGVNWTTQQTALSGPVALGRWPYGSNQGFLLVADKVYWTADDFATLVDKTGDLAVSNPRMIVPMWVQA